jgi:hypothetical protein
MARTAPARRRRRPRRTLRTTSASPDAKWLLLNHQIPPEPNYLRVKTARRLQRLGAVAIKNSVYVMPRTEQSYEDFEWVAREIVEGGGDASVCEARFVEGLSDDQVEELFHTARNTDYANVSQEVRHLRTLLGRRGKVTEPHRRTIESGVSRLRRRMNEIVAIDFFGASGRESPEGLLASLEESLHEPTSETPNADPKPVPEAMRGRTWVTRRGIHVDRMASAWLVRRFIDQEARFKFVPGAGYRPRAGEVRFDMFEAEFTHVGDRCTFEVLLQHFGLSDPPLEHIAEIVHDIDLKDQKFKRDDAIGLERVITGIAMTSKDDEARLTLGSAVFESLYEYFRRKK